MTDHPNNLASNGELIEIHLSRALFKAQGLLLIQKFVRRMKGSKRKEVNGQIFEKSRKSRALSFRANILTKKIMKMIYKC